MINAAKGCLCANHVFAVVFYERKHLSCFILCIPHDVVRHFLPAPPNAVYTVHNFLFPVVQYICAGCWICFSL